METGNGGSRIMPVWPVWRLLALDRSTSEVAERGWWQQVSSMDSLLGIERLSAMAGLCDNESLSSKNRCTTSSLNVGSLFTYKNLFS